MREKIVGGFYSVLSAAVWFSTFCGLMFLIYLLFTSGLREPIVTVNGTPTLSRAAAADPVLTEMGEDPADWYTLSMDVTVKGDALSPFEYRANGFYVHPAVSARVAVPYFVTSPEPLVFSHVAPMQTTATVYLKYSGDETALTQKLEGMQMRVDHLKQRVAFFDIELR